MGKLSTEGIGSSGPNKTLLPGNGVICIKSLKLESFRFKEGGFELVLECEGPDLGPEFEGFWVDLKDESLGRHAGQVGKIKATEWAFADGETKSGIKVSRDKDLMRFLKNLCDAAGVSDWFKGQNNIHDTVEQFVDAMNTAKLFTDKWFNACICGRAYTDTKGFGKFALYLPRFTQSAVALELIGVAKSKLIKFDEKLHTKAKKEAIEVDGFDAGSKRKGATNTDPLDDF
tara:strand:+ start:479 stop:1168 length:690 start_codon:yes stop_codon:yes gene_type:complete